MKSSKLLKITGILMIIGGALLIIIFLAGFVFGIFDTVNNTVEGGTYMLMAVIGLAVAIIDLVAGFMGVKSWNKPEKAKNCFTIGIVLIVISLLNNISSIYISGFNGTAVSNIVIGLILPVLYTYGAAQLKKSILKI